MCVLCQYNIGMLLAQAARGDRFYANVNAVVHKVIFLLYSGLMHDYCEV